MGGEGKRGVSDAGTVSVANALGQAVDSVLPYIKDGIKSHRVELKLGDDGQMTDLVTDIDRGAQERICAVLRRHFPHIPIVAEEGYDASLVASMGETYFTVEGLDGTKAFVNDPSHGVGTMVAYVSHGWVHDACVGDVMTGNLYLLRSSDAHVAVRDVSRRESVSVQTMDPSSLNDVPRRPLYLDGKILLRRPLEHFSWIIRAMVAGHARGGLFDGSADIDVSGGSIGVSMARLWCGEVDAQMMTSRTLTPWDMAPVVAISQRLGFMFLQLNERGRFQEILIRMRPEIIASGGDVLVLHRSNLHELLAWQEQWLKSQGV